MEEAEGSTNPFETPIPDEIRTIAQALAYREAEATDAAAVCRLINTAYKPESSGKEAFRKGDCVDYETVLELIESPEHRWLIVEAPGREAEDGNSLILGVSCFTTSGTSRKNGNIVQCCDDQLRNCFVRHS